MNCLIRVRFQHLCSNGDRYSCKRNRLQKISISFTEVNKYNLKKVYFIVHPKVDQRAGILSLLHLGIFAIHTRYFFKV